ncbi:phosphoglycerate mutase [Orenia metallireducens]|uniref:2,3-bisphosphoglycerate-independent phosphoglycerate mutase n=1 Tax=Orenia metallireducens TaxID=1413210 RepID=A0A285H5C0_9FIRM|nr:2,3-bisphosphoglycerate-independent phosphoglycerate mutase [Orenia metallireducens]PRX28648.1 phosphoglycerate mutase [Orenia metallireducens]SNY31040.1 phosphoglycerate mutase [Orenia metallireducens]
MSTPKPLALVILDGFGVNEKEEANAIQAANTPNFDRLWAEYPHTLVQAAGEAVGLPDGQMGNSEVGHLNLGAGRIVYQDLTRVTKSIKDGDFFENEVLLDAINKAKANDSALHLLGLLSDGGVHSHNQHLYGLLELAKKEDMEKVYVHAILDGRDVAPASAKTYVKELEAKMEEIGVGEIATIGGRYYYMDRDNRWDRTAKAYNAMVFGQGESANSALEVVENSYADDKTDEFVLPAVVLNEDGTPVAKVEENDSIIFFNFRPDRARQLTRALNDTDFNGFERQAGYPKVHLVCLTEYDETIDAPIAFPATEIVNTLGQVLAANGLKQLRTAETEKYAHVTFFFNGGKETPNEGEDRELIPSPDVATYDMKPEMSAYEVTDNLIKKMDEVDYDVIVLNFANPDMVGHTGDFDAEVTAVETVDECLGKVIDTILAKGGAALVTADHGNGEQMVDYDTGEPLTSHTTNPVPLLYINDNDKDAKLSAEGEGKLADFAPTMLKLLGIDIPAEMTGNQLIK